MRKEETMLQSKWQNSKVLQSKKGYQGNYKVSIVPLSLEQRINGAEPALHLIPLSVLATDLSPATAIAHYLKRHHSLSYAEIGRALNRDQRTIWTLLNRTKDFAATPKPSGRSIPLALFQDRTLSILEHTVSHLRRQDLTHKAISELLGRHPSTIATAHQRAQRKRQ